MCGTNSALIEFCFYYSKNKRLNITIKNGMPKLTLARVYNHIVFLNIPSKEKKYIQNFNVDRKYLIALSKFRTLPHNLEIEIGRHNNT